MTWWQVSAVANAVIMAAYMAISIAIGRALWRSGQWRKNRLGLATTAIFFTCGVHHGWHTVHLLLPDHAMHTLTGHHMSGDGAMPGMDMGGGEAGGGPDPDRAEGNPMRLAFNDPRTTAWDILTATAAVWYWTLRSRFPALVRGAAVFEDLKLRQAAEQTLRESEERYRGIVDTTSEGVALLDQEGRIGYANAQLADLVGRGGPELLTVDLVDLVVAEDRSKIIDGLARVRRDGTHRVEVGLCHAGGRPVSAQVALTARAGAIGEAEGVLAMVADVTDQKIAEAQLRQAQRLDAVGQLAGGVAHDFNNLLTVIDGYAEMLLTQADGPARADLSAIRSAADRAAGLTRQLLAFSRHQTAKPRAVDLNELVGGIEEMLRRLIREDVHLMVHADATPATVWADHGQLEQVIVNLAVNGRDAMPDGGWLTIATDHVIIDSADAARLGLSPGGHVVLSVTDTGHGMPPQVQARAFEPFFTTKDNKGTGLGLSTAYGIIRQAGGHITVDSAPGAGSTFRVYLAAVAAVADQRQADPSAERPAGGDETILLVEDDPAVRELTERILTAAGYRTLVAANGQEAIDLTRRHPTIDLLVTDVIMPGMNGRQVADRLTGIIPRLPVVFTSAHTHGILDERIEEAAVAFLDKPFTAATLTRTIRETLGRRVPSRRP
ncbi:hybrid sensor histidine kinase/response regulator [Frankia sp. AgKG'84/4]|uniref:hybrid sensor histidine kinase/response regulator n=1 Tax=Frankia sp. AgKG'84/4 TaxID=573490 RepID=UPI00200BA199|nr:response regulator [Frankia sp. AgKG'84/4]MCL9795482.1 response regulator [Frankia sp. AgKG'84/4]